MTLCNCCRQPFDGDPAGYHGGETVCQGCADALKASNIIVTQDP